MPPFFAPNTQFVVNAFAVQYAGKSFGRIGRFMVAGAGKYVDVVAAADLFQYIMVSKVWYVMYGRVKINLVIKKTFGVFCEVIHTAHGNYSIDKVWPF